jgi:hypothetical protein
VLLQQQQPQRWWLAAVVRACRKLDSWLGSSQAWLGLAGPYSSSSGSSVDLGSLLWRPVLLDVAGGYTVSSLDGLENDASPESLVTCILKVSSDTHQGCILKGCPEKGLLAPEPWHVCILKARAWLSAANYVFAEATYGLC